VGHLGLRVGEVLQPANPAGRVLFQADRAVRGGMGLSWNEPGGERDGRRGGVLVWTSGELGRVEARFRGVSPSRAGIVLYATASATQEDPCQGWNPAWDCTGVRLWFAGQLGGTLQCRYDAEGLRGSVQSEATLQASRTGGLQEILQERFRTIGEELVVEQLDCSQLEPGLFLAPSAIKALRRAVLESVQGCGAAAPAASMQPQPPSEPEAVCERSEYAIRIYQEQHVEAFLREPAPPLGWVLPLACAREAGSRAPSGAQRYWIPWVFGPGAADELAPLLDELPDGEFLCFSWEALELAARFPRHRFSVDATFNVSNARAAAVLARCGVGFDRGLEAQGPLPGAQRVVRVNPLVSCSRFPGPADGPRDFRNDRGDIFHLHPLGAAEGLFLQRWPDTLPAGTGPLRVDAFVPPGETVASFAQRLRQWWDGAGGASG
jgi:hypothetical protein